MRISRNIDHSSEAESLYNLGVRFPYLPFKIRGGSLRVFHRDQVVNPMLLDLTRKLAEQYGDNKITYWSVQESPEFFKTIYDRWPGFQMTPDTSDSEFGAVMDERPLGDVNGILRYASDVVAVWGDSREWQIWSEYDWEIAVLRSKSSSQAIFDELSWEHSGYDETIGRVRGFPGSRDSINEMTLKHMKLAAAIATDQLTGRP